MKGAPGPHPIPNSRQKGPLPMLGAAAPSLTDALQAVDTVWVIVAAVFVLFMQAGFLLLEIGFSRQKNVGTVVPKILANLSIASIGYWAVGFALAFGGSGWFAGTEGTFLDEQPRPVPGDVRVGGCGPGQVLLPVRLLRRLARHRLGHDARADQVR